MSSSTPMRTFVIGTALALGITHGQAVAQDRDEGRGAVYTLTNASAGNGLVVLDRGPHGHVVASGVVPTGGLGTGSGLGSQGALALGEGGRALYAVNAGSDQISVFVIGSGGPVLAQVLASGGQHPLSLAVHEDLLYALNAGGAVGGSDGIAGFRVGAHGLLTPLAGSARALSAASTGPAQIGFSDDGSVLIITEKTTNLIDTFAVGHTGHAGPAVTHPSSGMTPFGFVVNGEGQLIVTEAFGGAPGLSAVSSYLIGHGGTLTLLDASVPTTQTAACWTVSTRNSRFTYATNTGSASVSGFRVHDDGELAPLGPNGRTGETGATPIDAAVVGDRFLYVLAAGAHDVEGFRIRRDGGLEPLNAVSGLPAGSVGLAAQ